MLNSETKPRAGHSATPGKSFGARAARDFDRNKALYLMIAPVIILYIIFSYIPMFGVVIAFKDYRPASGVLGSAWSGIKHFKAFFTGYYFARTVRNTLMLSLLNLIFAFPAPIALALLLNEVRSSKYKRLVQTFTYFPHFVSQVVICGIILQFCLSDGLFNSIRGFFGLPAESLLQDPANFRSVYIASSIWQGVGWGSIIYLAAITGIDPQLYEAAALDGASRIQNVFNITLPGIRNTVVILFIMQIGRMMSVGTEKILLLYNPAIYETSDVISTYVYRRGMINMDWSFSTAVDLFNSVINFGLVIMANAVSRRVSETSLF